MKPQLAISKLEELKEESRDPNALYRNAEAATSWKSRVRALVARALGERNVITENLDKNSYSLSAWSSSTPDSAWADAFVAGIHRVRGYIDAAIFELQLLTGDDDPVDERSFDPELWDHTKGLIEAQDWSKVPATVSIFVEDKIRTWVGLGGDIYGKGLYGQVLGDAGELRLGAKKSEWEGWRAMGIGFAQAIGNVARHRLQDREDARRYAIGVLGLGSLILTQMRHEHGELIEEADSSHS